MDQIFQIGDFTFRMRYPNEVSPPPNFLLFTQMRHSDFIHAGEAYGEDHISVPQPEYTYEIRVSDVLPQPTGKVIARRPDLVVFQETDGTEWGSGADEAVKSGSDGKPKDNTAEALKGGYERSPEHSAGGHPALESRLIGVKGTEGYYACYRETGPDRAEVVLARDRIEGLHIDHDPQGQSGASLRLCVGSRRGDSVLRAVGDGKNDSGESLGEIPGQPDGQRRPGAAGKNRRPLARPGLAGLRNL